MVKALALVLTVGCELDEARRRRRDACVDCGTDGEDSAGRLAARACGDGGSQRAALTIAADYRITAFAAGYRSKSTVRAASGGPPSTSPPRLR